MKTKEELHRYNSNMIYRARLIALEILGGKCVRCGFSDVRALQLDHIDGGGYEERKHNKQYRNYRMIAKDPVQGRAKFQILCANCNWIKRVEKKEFRGGISNLDR